MTERLRLREEDRFASGGRRDCYVHPFRPDRCVKVLNERGDPRRRRREAVWYKRLRPLSRFDDNLRELAAFRELARKGEAVWRHFPRCYGMVETSRGPGIVTDLIRDADGTISRTVRQYVKECGKTDELRAALEAFFDFLREYRVITRDLLDHNLVVRSGPEGLAIVMIDGFGSANFLPLERWIPVLGRRKVERKIDRFLDRYRFR